MDIEWREKMDVWIKLENISKHLCLKIQSKCVLAENREWNFLGMKNWKYKGMDGFRNKRGCVEGNGISP